MKTIFKTLCMLVFLGIAMQVQAQTKEETIKWLTEKMMKPCFLEDVGNSEHRISFVEFDDNFLILKIVKNKTKDDRYGKARTWSLSYQINLIKLMSAYITDEGKLRTEGNYMEETDDEGHKGFKSVWHFTTINSSCEPDIRERFRKAIEHYQSLMTVKKSNETF